MAQLYHAESGAHIRTKQTTESLMRDVIIALLPVLAAGVYFYGLKSLVVVLLSVITSVLSEYVYNLLMKRTQTVGDLSAVVTGLLLGLTLSPLVPWWAVVVGSSFAIIIVKMMFGGLGHNFVNPALAGRALMLASWPGAMNIFMNPQGSPDLISTATPLAIGFSGDLADYLQLFLGNKAGSIGEISAAALLLGAAYLLIRRVITWHIPVAYLATVFVYAAILHLVMPGASLPPHVHLLSGGLLLGAFFMATDMVTSPLTRRGMLVFGVGCGVITMLIRTVKTGAYPEGVSFAILIMNAFTPLINRATRNRVFGTKKECARS